MYSEIISLFSPLWWKCFSTFLFLMGSSIYFCFRIQPALHQHVAKALGAFIFLDALLLQCVTYWDGNWTLAYSLPLQFCNIIAFIAALALIFQYQWCYEICLFIGILAPFQAIFTPALANEAHGYYLLQYFFSHGITIFAPIYLTLAFKMRPRKAAWWKSVLPFTLLLPPLYLLNHIVKGNYLFLMYAPPLPHALIIGPWPCYLLIWMALFLLTSFLIHCLIRHLPQDQDRQDATIEEQKENQGEQDKK